MLVQAEFWTLARTEKGNAVLIRGTGGKTAVPIFIGPLESQNILLALGKVDIPRPMTHDLMGTLLELGNLALQHVEIYALREGTFYSNLVLNRGGETLEVDCRPSDALALALRLGCPLYLEQDLLEDSSVALPLGDIPSASGQRLEADFVEDPAAQNPRDQLRKQLEQAVLEENYEEAARLRDEIRELDAED